MNKSTFDLVFGLARSQPWLSERSSEISSILFDECQDDFSREMICEILGRFSYVSLDRFREMVESLALDIMTMPGLSEETTQVVAMAADSTPDSSQELIYRLKSKFPDLGWERNGLVNRFGKAYKKFQEGGFKDIVLVDEFVGSGKTVTGRVAEIKAQFKSGGVCDYSIRVRVLVATEIGLKVVRDAGIDISSVLVIKKAIDDYYDPSVVASYQNKMIDIESRFSAEFEGREMPSMGYGGVQAAYYREDANTPNSVFPVFWWPAYVDGSRRNRLLIRAVIDA